MGLHNLLNRLKSGVSETPDASEKSAGYQAKPSTGAGCTLDTSDTSLIDCTREIAANDSAAPWRVSVAPGTPPDALARLRAASLALDKVRAKAVAQSAGVPVSRHVAFDIRSWRGDESEARRLIREIVGFPCVVKAPCQGSSVGLAMCSDEGSLRDCVEAVLPMEGRVMVEQYVAGREITASILDASEDGSLLPLPLIEIRPKHSAWFDYEAKYTPGASDEIVPAPIEEAHRQRIAELAVLAHEAIGCAGWSRSDFILRDDGTPVWLELNTVPGLTETSLFPQAAAATGITYELLVDLFVRDAVRRGVRQGR